MSSINPISTNSTENYPPSVVLQTAESTNEQAITGFGNQTVIELLLLLYLAEIEPLNVSESRILGVSINGEDQLTNIHLANNFSAVQLTFLLQTPMYAFTIFKTPNSSRGPILNAFELYQLLQTQPATFPNDGKVEFEECFVRLAFHLFIYYKETYQNIQFMKLQKVPFNLWKL